MAPITVLLEEPTSDQDVSPRAQPAGAAAAGTRGRLPAPLLLVLACLALAALSLLAPSAPTYDPWSWIVWGREITHLDLVTTTGPSWKPLPVLFTTAFAPLGGAAPALWLVVARAGALAAVALAYLLGRALGAGRVGAGAAAVALATAPWWTANAWLGNSEALLVACVLGAVLAHLHGHRRGAFALAVAAGLLRPEAWPFLGLYGLWLVWRDRGKLRLVAGGLALMPLLWLAPEQWGSGDLWRASNRAQTDLPPGSPGRAEHPALEILRSFWELLPRGVWAAVAVAAVAGVVAVRRRAIPWPVLALGILATAWVALVAVMASTGYSGNQRYLIAPAAMVIVLAGIGAAAALRVLPGVLRPLAAAGVLAAFALTGLLDTIDREPEAIAQSRLPGDLQRAVADAGGAQRLRACGPIYTDPLLVPAVAWRLGMHLGDVDYRPVAGSAVVVRGRVSSYQPVAPSLEAFAGLPQRTLAVAPRWRILATGRCAA